MTSRTHIYEQYWRELCRVIRRKFGSGPPDPEEAAQVAFEQFTAVSQKETIHNPRAFLHRCAYNYMIDQRRRQTAQNRWSEDIVALNVTGATDEFDAQRVLEARERLAVVVQAVEGMEAKRRKILLLHTIDELSFAEIARQMKLSPTRVMQLFAEALAQCAGAARRASLPSSRTD